MADLFTPEQRALLLANGAEYERNENFDPHPVVKLSMPERGMTWLLASLDPEFPELAFGLADLGMGFPEMGSIGLREIEDTCAEFGLRIECAPHFVGKKPLSEYANAARRARTIVEG